MSLETEAVPLDKGTATKTESLDESKITKTDDTGKTSTQWAKVPETAAYMGLDATALNVLIILAAKAGRERTAWISQQTVADRLSLDRTTISKAIRRLEKHDLVRKCGKVVVNHERGTWVYRYNVAPYLPEVRLEVTSGLADVNEGLPGVTLGGPDVNLGGPDVNPGFTHSVPIDQSLSFSPSISVEPVGKEKQERPQERTEETGRESNPNPLTEWNDRNNPDRRDRRGYG